MNSHWPISQCNVARVRLFSQLWYAHILYLSFLSHVMPFQTHFHPTLFPHFVFFLSCGCFFFCHLIQSRSHSYLHSSRFILLLFLFVDCALVWTAFYLHLLYLMYSSMIHFVYTHTHLYLILGLYIGFIVEFAHVLRFIASLLKMRYVKS